MTIPSSPVKLTQIIAEFGPDGPNPAPRTLTSYKKSPTGPYVGVNPNTANIASSNPVTLLAFGSESHGYNTTDTYTIVGSGTAPIPSGARAATIEIWGGGGAGGRRALCSAGGGGGSGSYARYSFPLGGTTSSDWTKTFNYTVGAGGALGPSNGGNGQTSTVSAGSYAGAPFVLITVPGGFGGIAGTRNGPDGAGGPGGYTGSGGPSGTVFTGGTAAGGCVGASAVVGLTAPAGGKGGCGACRCGVVQPASSGTSGVVRFTWS